MPYFLETDTFHSEPAWEVLAKGSRDLIDRLQGAYTRMKSRASHLLSDGYLTEGAVLDACWGRKSTVELLCTPVLGGQPLLHRQGDDCDCLGDSWTEGYTYRVHAFLKRNPSKREYLRNRAQKADLRDANLKAMVYKRDGGCCRYCGSGRLSPKAVRSRDRRKVLQFDHVDPDSPAGPDGANLVVACGRCNEHKGRRTPYEADMVLLAAPTTRAAAAMLAAPMQLRDDPPAARPRASDLAQTGRGSANDHENGIPTTDQDQKPITDPVADPITDPVRDPIADLTPSVRPSTTGPDAHQRSERDSQPSGSGRGGARSLIREGAASLAGQPQRSGMDPDVYHRRSRPAVQLQPPAFVQPAPWPPAFPWPECQPSAEVSGGRVNDPT